MFLSSFTTFYIHYYILTYAAVVTFIYTQTNMTGRYLLHIFLLFVGLWPRAFGTEAKNLPMPGSRPVPIPAIMRLGLAAGRPSPSDVTPGFDSP